MSKKEFKSGSEWRKWDLHLHTPASYDYKNSSISAKDIAKKLKEKNISVIAITDHHIIDKNWIENIKKESNEIDHKITIFPGMEIRTELVAKENIHIIAIFKEDSDINNINDELRIKLDINSEEKKGKSKDKIYCDYRKSINTIKELNGIISIHCGEKANGIEDIKNYDEVKQAIKEKMVEEINIFEIGNSIKDIISYKQHVFPEINRQYPLILCSDNHNILKYYENKKMFTWIKADPTFDGLKQILYEPEERVKIQEDIPEFKESFNIIDSILIKDKESGKELNEISFNQNLNSIIGEKSSGKSFLLYSMARTILGEENFYNNNKYTEEKFDKPKDGDKYNDIIHNFLYFSV